MEMIKTSAPKTSKNNGKTTDLYSAQTNYMHRDKGNTAADSEIRTAVFEYSKGVGTNGTLVHEMSHSSDRTVIQAKAAHNGCKRIAMFSIALIVNKIVQMKELKEDGYLMSQTLKQERD
jgi:hypothetical protein